MFWGNMSEFSDSAEIFPYSVKIMYCKTTNKNLCGKHPTQFYTVINYSPLFQHKPQNLGVELGDQRDFPKEVNMKI